jgi:sporulation protein YlmC with PRC-barrel domain
MRRASIFLSMLIMAAMLLAACGGEETSTSVPSTDVPPITAEATATIDDLAGTETADPDTTPVVPVTGEESPSRMSNLLDFDVWNQNSEQIGDVEDMVLDMDNTRISYVIVGTGGFLGLGEKEVLVPWDMLELQSEAGEATDAEGNAFIFTGDPEFYNNAPDIDVDSVLPEWNTPAGDWDTDIRNFWASGVVPETTAVTDTPAADGTAVPDVNMTATVAPGTDPGQGQFQGTDLQGVILATDVIGSTILVQGNPQALGPDQGLSTAAPDASADPLATATLGPDPAAIPGSVEIMNAFIEDIIVDPESGEIQYLVITGSFLDGDRWIPVPLGFLQWDETNQNFTLRVNAAALQNAPFFEGGQFPDFSVDNWDDEFDGFWKNPDAATATP